MTTQKSILPYIIIGAFVLFMTFILQFVFRSMKSDVQLVSSNYYQQEINYQSHIDKQKRSALIKENSTISLSNNQLTIDLAKSVAQAKGEIHLYNGSNADLDLKNPFEFTENTPLIIPSEDLEQGIWTVKIDFVSNGETYYIEKKLVK